MHYLRNHKNDIGIKTFISIQDDSPMKSEFNELGQYIMISLCFMIGTLIEFAVVLLIKQVYKEGENRIDEIEKYLARVSNSIFTMNRQRLIVL